LKLYFVRKRLAVPVGGGIFNRQEALLKWKRLFTTFVTLFEF
jgi:hypothetical protein